VAGTNEAVAQPVAWVLGQASLLVHNSARWPEVWPEGRDAVTRRTSTSGVKAQRPRSGVSEVWLRLPFRSQESKVDNKLKN